MAHTHTEYWIKCVCLRRPVHSPIINVVLVNERWNSTRNPASLVFINLFLAFKILTPLSTSLSAAIPLSSPYLHSTDYKHAVNGVKHNELRKPTAWVNTYTNSDVSPAYILQFHDFNMQWSTLLLPDRVEYNCAFLNTYLLTYSFIISLCNEVRYYFLTELNITEYFSNTYLLTYSFIISLCNEVRYYFLTELNITVFLNTYLLTYLLTVS